ncbi:DNA glycosylase AlkZ-like family protein [Staphylococcus americanisciuri]|uniref:Winged helix DNA-binding domain-containing protein n=1 Tax=Staphylococcus americanisciuri TaxID=2973940 RepID=A0ABT2EZS7_9STAP|nr:crosslink repair DNA glycosylase YcaQ family protein [Staphylococcus americanisciuri]MCS4485706.1 winged helix DNA-binding domain-containing protein [Staphylococcus americanisciuri]
MQISNKQIKNFSIFKQRLNENNYFTDIYHALDSVGIVQLDSINVFLRAQDLYFINRIKSYEQEDLLKYYEKFKISENYSRALTINNIQDDNKYLWTQTRFYEKYKGSYNTEDFVLMEKILESISENTLLPFKELTNIYKYNKSKGWKTGKIQDLTSFLFRTGQIGILRDKNFQRYLYKKETIDNPYSYKESLKYYVLRSLEGLGVLTAKEIAFEWKVKINDVQGVLSELEKSNEVCALFNEGEKHYILNKDIEYFNNQSNEIVSKNVFLSPFDNLIYNRTRLKKLFSFDYRLEAYIPKKKRKNGYYALPILIENNLIGTIDLNYNREEKELIVLSLNILQAYRNRKIERQVFSLLEYYAEKLYAKKITRLNY